MSRKFSVLMVLVPDITIGLDNAGIEPLNVRDFPHQSGQALRPTLPAVQWVPGHSRRVNRPGYGGNHPLSSSTEVKERVELYLCSSSMTSWQVTC